MAWIYLAELGELLRPCVHGAGQSLIVKESALAALLARDDWDEAAKLLRGMDYGVPLRDYAIGALGDSVVVQQARSAFQILTGLTLPD
jgi:hypothetical protein